MSKVSVTELRQNRRIYLATVRRCQRIKVTARGQLIAEIVPAATSTDEADPARVCLRGSVVKYEFPPDPVFDSAEWKMNQ